MSDVCVLGTVSGMRDINLVIWEYIVMVIDKFS